MDILNLLVLGLSTAASWAYGACVWVFNCILSLFLWVLRLIGPLLLPVYNWIGWTHGTVWVDLCGNFFAMNFKVLIIGILYPLCLFLYKVKFEVPRIDSQRCNRQMIPQTHEVPEPQPGKNQWVKRIVTMVVYLFIGLYLLVQLIRYPQWIQSILGSYCDGSTHQVRSCYVESLDLNPSNPVLSIIQLYVRSFLSVFVLCTSGYGLLVWSLFYGLGLKIL